MKRSILNVVNKLELLEFLVRLRPTTTTTLIVCSSKQEFLHQILPGILRDESNESHPSQQGTEEDELTGVASKHPFLTPTLQLIAASRAIKIVFCPSINSLRAYLASYVFTRPVDPVGQSSSVQATMVILDLILLHHGTSEFSVQGLSRTLANAVEAAARNDMNLHLVECEDFQDPQNPNRGPKLWDAQVPLLSGSVRLGGDGANWSGRMFHVKRIAGRWFAFNHSPTKDERKPPMEAAEDEQILV